MPVVGGNLSFVMPGGMLVTAFLLLNAPTAAADNNAPEAIASLELSRMSLEDLGKIEIPRYPKSRSDWMMQPPQFT
jgi:hypothetical protein